MLPSQDVWRTFPTRKAHYAVVEHVNFFTHLRCIKSSNATTQKKKTHNQAALPKFELSPPRARPRPPAPPHHLLRIQYPPLSIDREAGRPPPQLQVHIVRRLLLLLLPPPPAVLLLFFLFSLLLLLLPRRRSRPLPSTGGRMTMRTTRNWRGSGGRRVVVEVVVVVVVERGGPFPASAAAAPATAAAAAVVTVSLGDDGERADVRRRSERWRRGRWQGRRG